jgi:hypothetical protein
MDSATENKEEGAWQEVVRPWMAESVTNQASTGKADSARSADENETETLQRWLAEPSKDQHYNTIGYVRLSGQQQSRNG